MRKVLVLVLSLVMVFGLMACAAPAAEPAPAPAPAPEAPAPEAPAQEAPAPEAPAEEAPADGGELHFGVSLPTLAVTFFAQMATELNAAFPTDRVSITIINAEDSQEKQVSDIENLISMGVDGIVLIPITVEGTIHAIRDANEAGIPVITVDRGIPDDAGVDIVSWVGSDHYEIGLNAGRLLLQTLEEMFPDADEWTVVELEGTPGSLPAIERGRGINEILDAEPRVNIIMAVTGQFDTAPALAIAEDALTANPDLHAFICHNDMMAEGVHQALVNHNMVGEVIVIGIDGQISTVERIAEGTIHGTVIQFPGRMAVRGIELLVRYIDGGSVDAEEFVPTEMINPENAQYYLDNNIAW